MQGRTVSCYVSDLQAEKACRRYAMMVASQFIGWYKRLLLDAVCRRYIDIRGI